MNFKKIACVFPVWGPRRGNDDKYSHNQKKRKPSTYAEGKNKCTATIALVFNFFFQKHMINIVPESCEGDIKWQSSKKL